MTHTGTGNWQLVTELCKPDGLDKQHQLKSCVQARSVAKSGMKSETNPAAFVMADIFLGTGDAPLLLRKFQFWLSCTGSNTECF